MLQPWAGAGKREQKRKVLPRSPCNSLNHYRAADFQFSITACLERALLESARNIQEAAERDDDVQSNIPNREELLPMLVFQATNHNPNERSPRF